MSLNGLDDKTKRKILQLDERARTDVGSEAENAKRLRDRLLKKHKLTIEQVRQADWQSQPRPDSFEDKIRRAQNYARVRKQAAEAKRNNPYVQQMGKVALDVHQKASTYPSTLFDLHQQMEKTLKGLEQVEQALDKEEYNVTKVLKCLLQTQYNNTLALKKVLAATMCYATGDLQDDSLELADHCCVAEAETRRAKTWADFTSYYNK